MKVGERIEVIADWSSFRGMRGRLVQTQPYLMAVLDDDPRPIRVSRLEIALVESEHPMVAGE